MSSRFKLISPATAAMAATALMLASCSNDDVQVVNQGTEITFNTQVSRATETTLENLKGFRVWAHAEGYTSMFINGDVAAKKDGEDGTYVLTKNYYWPNDVDKIQFWAYGPSGKRADGGVEVNPNITVDGQSFSGLKPHVSLTEGGKDQRDFVVAYTEATRSTASGMSVKLKFDHAFSQVIVQARKGADADKRVKIKGGWIVNAKTNGTLTFSGEPEYDEVNHMKWTIEKEGGQVPLESYGVTFAGEPNYRELSSGDYTTIIGGGDNSSLMLIPQQTDGVTFKDGKATNSGAYILLLCRVEELHPGADHPGGSDSPVGVEGDKHVHQLFPVSTKYNAEEYGYTCVPLTIDWKPGKKYVYNLEFCGTNSGAGVYPPKPGEGFPTDNVVEAPADKEGLNVLSAPIKFSVSVSGWTEAPNTPNMN